MGIPASGIFCANRLSVSQSTGTLPSVSEAVTGWFRPLILGRVTSNIVNGEVEEVVKEFTCMGVIQPFGPRELKLKSEGQRSWNWVMLHTTPDVALRDQEQFRLPGRWMRTTPFRVMSQHNYSEYGYIEYELVQDFQPRT